MLLFFCHFWFETCEQFILSLCSNLLSNSSVSFTSIMPLINPPNLRLKLCLMKSYLSTISSFPSLITISLAIVFNLAAFEINSLFHDVLWQAFYFSSFITITNHFISSNSSSFSVFFISHNFHLEFSLFFSHLWPFHLSGPLKIQRLILFVFTFLLNLLT